MFHIKERKNLTMNKIIFGFGFAPVYDNSIEVFIPELWANESISILIENMIAGNLVYRDFENVLARYGDVVNVAKPAELTAKRKAVSDNVTIQDVSADTVRVPLDQHIHTSFLIRDGEESKSFKSLVDEYLRPAIIAQARLIDQIVLGQYPQFLGNSAGTLNGMTTSNAKTNLLTLRQVLNINKAPVNGRNIVLNPLAETVFLNLDIFTQAQQVGDQGQALQEALLGRKLGWDFWMDQNMAVVNTGNTPLAGAINSGNVTKGSTVLTTTFTGAVAVGTWLTIAGDDTPHRVQAVTNTLGNTTSITIESPGLRAAVATNAVITTYVPGTVNLSGGYAAGWQKAITVATFTVAPQVGQLVSFGLSGSSAIYTVVAVSGLTSITLDRPLDAAISNSDAVNIGPAGGYNLAFHRNAIALVVRPLAMPRAGTGALSAVASWNNLSMRITITYDGNKQGHLVTADMLAGIAVLDNRLGGVLYS